MFEMVEPGKGLAPPCACDEAIHNRLCFSPSFPPLVRLFVPKVDLDPHPRYSQEAESNEPANGHWEMRKSAFSTILPRIFDYLLLQ